VWSWILHTDIEGTVECFVGKEQQHIRLLYTCFGVWDDFPGILGLQYTAALAYNLDISGLDEDGSYVVVHGEFEQERKQDKR